ncbi:hypothetical protein H9P43_007034 [Blastocladiella emersonii ATCC 22665]|nr:hypothetical protein H9P43_007034 [Blastocladiella emersonii ATCC 22665]
MSSHSHSQPDSAAAALARGDHAHDDHEHCHPPHLVHPALELLHGAEHFAETRPGWGSFAKSSPATRPAVPSIVTSNPTAADLEAAPSAEAVLRPLARAARMPISLASPTAHAHASPSSALLPTSPLLSPAAAAAIGNIDRVPSPLVLPAGSPLDRAVSPRPAAAGEVSLSSPNSRTPPHIHTGLTCAQCSASGMAMQLAAAKGSVREAAASPVLTMTAVGPVVHAPPITAKPASPLSAAYDTCVHCMQSVVGAVKQGVTREFGAPASTPYVNFRQ